jgi:hypothetical protein
MKNPTLRPAYPSLIHSSAWPHASTASTPINAGNRFYYCKLGVQPARDTDSSFCQWETGTATVTIELFFYFFGMKDSQLLSQFSPTAAINL